MEIIRSVLLEIASLFRTAISGLVLAFLLPHCRSVFAVEVSDTGVLCRQHLKAIHGAIQQYRHLRLRLPDQLSDLVALHLLSPEILVCPTEIDLSTPSSTGRAESYRYEFEPRPLTNELAKGLGLTLRSWRQLQMGRLGSEVPLVRCMHHTPTLNLAFGGSIYESGRAWEERFASLVKKEDLTLEALLTNHVHLEVTRVLMRESGSAPEQIDLTRYYNRSLKGSPEWAAENTPIELPAGRTVLKGVAFDARGIVQLGSKNFTMMHRPAAVSNIVVGLACQRLVFLHGAVASAGEGVTIDIGEYIVHFEDGAIKVVPITYGRHVLDWRTNPATVSSPNLESVGRIVHEVRGPSSTTWLYSTLWLNPHPDIPIDHLDFVTLMTESSPFLVAVTAQDITRASESYGGKANPTLSDKTEIKK
jgi:hypothetical protein